MSRPRQDMKEWDEAEAAGKGAPSRFAYALWLMLWHHDAECADNVAWGALTREARAPGYDGELLQLTGGAA